MWISKILKISLFALKYSKCYRPEKKRLHRKQNKIRNKSKKNRKKDQ